jgi:hypothetical protein
MAARKKQRSEAMEVEMVAATATMVALVPALVPLSGLFIRGYETSLGWCPI